MISVNDFKTGLTIEFDNDIWQVIEFQHVKPGKGAAFVRSKLKNLRSGHTQDKTFRAGEKVAPAHIERQDMQYLYEAGGMYAFMNTETYEQIEIAKAQIEHEVNFLIENMEVMVISFQSEILGVTLPNNIELAVVEADPGVRGNTVSGGSKSAVLETGLTIQVPMFINEGDRVVVSTTDGKYVSRVN